MLSLKVEQFINELNRSINRFNKYIKQYNYEIEVTDRYVQTNEGVKKINQYIKFKTTITHNRGKKAKDYTLIIHKLYDKLPNNLNVKKIEFNKKQLIKDIKNDKFGKYKIANASIDVLTKMPTIVLYNKNGLLYNFEHDYLKIIFE